MFLLDDASGVAGLVYSAGDLTEAAGCEFAAIRNLDRLLHRLGPIATAPDGMLERTMALGQAHEQRVLEELRTGPDGTPRSVVEIQSPKRHNRQQLMEKHTETLQALRAGADIVYQGTFFDGSFLGRADFLIREADGYQVADTKLARSAKITALLQVAAYADQLSRAGIATSDRLLLILGDGSRSLHSLAEILAVYRDRRRRFEEVIAEHAADDGPVHWNDERFSACGSCNECCAEVTANDDLLLVAKLKMTQRKKLRMGGIQTMHQLARAAETVPGLPIRTFETLRAQALLQCRNLVDDDATDILYDVFNPAGLAMLPPADQGDIFFDFEGDPLWAEGGSTDWGLEYLFGVVERSRTADGKGPFIPFWAHTRAEEKLALEKFLTYVSDRRQQFPGMHIYHYAAYEKSALLRLAVRHRVGEKIVDDLLRAGVLVDLYAVVRSSLRVSQPSYSIKKLEPLYMGTDLRDAEGVTNAADSIVQYQLYCLAREAGHDDEADVRLKDIADYNQYDCDSTLQLLRWLRERAADNGIEPAATLTLTGMPATVTDDADAVAIDAVVAQLFDAADAESAPAEKKALALMAAAIDFHTREEKPFWWAHFDRLVQPSDEWMDARGSLVVARATVHQDWHKPAKARTFKRRTSLVGRLEPGSTVTAGADVYALYDPPRADCMKFGADGGRGWLSASVKVVGIADDGQEEILVEETTPTGGLEFSALPMAIAPGPPPSSRTLQSAIRTVAEQLTAPGGSTASLILGQCSFDILARRTPRLIGRSELFPLGLGDDRYIDAITESVKALDRSYLAVQGPPGTGKTFTGSRVIKRLVDLGWKIGVVGQSHALVENMLRGVLDAGVESTQVAKKRSDPNPVPWQTPDKNPEYGQFIAAQASGWVIGGTSWDFVNAAKLPPGSLDLLVIDEAGQFSLANTIATSVSAQRLLLLGDPQQLPQVSQGSHPEPVDRSALGWLSAGHGALPAEFGYFLETTWRMHPDLCARVSALAYENQLHSQPSTLDRQLLGHAPGVDVVQVNHRGNSVESVEEADEVVNQVRKAVGASWIAGAGVPARPLTAADFLVVAPYNAQVWNIRERLTDAGFAAARVGTVDKFQGQEAPVVIVSMTASAMDDVPRGIDFLLSRNRLNVAVSRGQWRAVIIRSEALTDFLPRSPAGLAELGAFITLCGG